MSQTQTQPSLDKSLFLVSDLKSERETLVAFLYSCLRNILVTLNYVRLKTRTLVMGYFQITIDWRVVESLSYLPFV